MREDREMMNNQEQWQQDVKDYGENAYLMWHSYGIQDYPGNNYVDFESNDEFLSFINSCKYGYDDVVERKQSAALPFDLERAMAGDAFEVLHGGMWKKAVIASNEIDDEQILVVFESETGKPPAKKKWVDVWDLRMRYPKKC